MNARLVILPLIAIALLAAAAYLLYPSVAIIIRDFTSPCEKPLIPYKDGCCVDRNNDQKCDNQPAVESPASANVSGLESSTTVSTTQTTTSTLGGGPSTTQTTWSSTTIKTASTATTTIRCKSGSDCGNTTSVLVCRLASVYNVSTVYSCRFPGEWKSYCTIGMKEEPVKNCMKSERCGNGECVKIRDSDCDMECYSRWYDGYYCYHTTDCRAGDQYIDLMQNNCQTPNPYCCCRGSTTTTTLSGSPVRYPYVVAQNTTNATRRR